MQVLNNFLDKSTRKGPFYFNVAIARGICVPKRYLFCTPVLVQEYFFKHKYRKYVSKFRTKEVTFPVHLCKQI